MIPRILWHYMLAMRSCRFSKEELKRLQDQRLKRIIHHAYSNVPLYHRWFHSKGVTPGDIRGIDDLRLLPILTRREIKENFPDGITPSNKNIRGIRIRTTSGTTGPPLNFLQDSKYRDMIMVLKLRRRPFLGLRLTDKLANIIYVGPSKSNSVNPHSRLKPAFRRMYKLLSGHTDQHWPTLRNKTLGIKKDVGDVAEDVLKFEPTVIYSRPSYLRRLGRFFKDRSLHVEKIICTGEVLSKGCKKELANLYQADVYQTYGSAEFGSLANECAKHTGMHLESDYLIFEFLQDGESASPGEPAEVVITSLFNDIMPLIRYRTGDIAILEEEDRCECGLTLPRLQEIQGRLSDGLISEDDVRIPPGPIIDYLESALGLRDFQLIQKDKHNVLAKLKSQFDTPSAKEALLAYLKSILGQEIALEVEDWGDKQIPPKYRPITSNVTAAAEI